MPPDPLTYAICAVRRPRRLRAARDEVAVPAQLATVQVKI